MVEPSHIREHMEVVGSDGQHVGTVDRVEGQRVKLAKTDPAAGGEPHMPLAIVTGASAGIGYELAKICAHNGFDLGSRR